MIINSYKLKNNISINDLLKEGFDYSCDRKYLTKTTTLNNSIILWIRIALKDFTTKIEVLDDEFCQYYIPFYEYQNKEIKSFKSLNKVIDKYNSEMNKLKCFELNN